MSIPYNLASSDDVSCLTVFVNGQVKTANNSHPAWRELVAAVTGGDADPDALLRLLDSEKAVNDFFEKVSDRVSVSGGHVFVDNEEINDGLADAIIRFMNEGNDAGPLVNFLEKILTNPNEHSREQLYDWLSKRNFTITADGDFIAYKGVRRRDQSDDLVQYPYESIHSGRAIVDGVPYIGAIPNGVDAVVEMPRGDVAHDPNVACHSGLHAGNWRYASSFSQGAVLTVKINPRDVVSVPHDSNSEKIRTCRYTVIDDTATQEYPGAYLDEDEEDSYDDYDGDYEYY